MNDLEQEIDVLKRQRIADCKRIRAVEEWIDVVSSPLWKRLWFFVCGWNWSTLGRWYLKDRWKG